MTYVKRVIQTSTEVSAPLQWWRILNHQTYLSEPAPSNCITVVDGNIHYIFFWRFSWKSVKVCNSFGWKHSRCCVHNLFPLLQTGHKKRSDFTFTAVWSGLEEKIPNSDKNKHPLLSFTLYSHKCHCKLIFMYLRDSESNWKHVLCFTKRLAVICSFCNL